jgi:hypothetical protein
VYAGLGVVAGAAAAMVGARMTWLTDRTPSPGSASVPGLGSVRFPDVVVRRAAPDVVLSVALLLLVASLFVLLVGPRARAVALVVCCGCAAYLATHTSVAGARRAGAVRTVSAAPKLVLAGAVVAGVSALLAFPSALRVPRFGMPESAPEAAEVAEAAGAGERAVD